MTNDEVRKIFHDSGLTYDDLTLKNLHRLRDLIDIEMKSGDFFRGTYGCHLLVEFDKGPPFWAGIKCKADYFDDREAVSFNRDGFIGFAGWASSGNVKPILDGFIKWIKELKEEK